MANPCGIRNMLADTTAKIDYLKGFLQLTLDNHEQSWYTASGLGDLGSTSYTRSGAAHSS